MRGNNILGLVRRIGPDGLPEPGPAKDKQGKPYTTLGYINGPGTKPTADGRADLSGVDTADPNYLQEAEIPLGSETHGGEDVAIFATGPNAYLVRGSMEENWIFYVMADALRLRKQ
jgi:alkaline phosphatase